LREIKNIVDQKENNYNIIKEIYEFFMKFREIFFEILPMYFDDEDENEKLKDIFIKNFENISYIADTQKYILIACKFESEINIV